MALNNIARATQPIDFDGIGHNKTQATDIDAIMEYHDVLYILYEVKYKDKEMTYGQRLCYERLVKDLAVCGKPVIAMVCEHCASDTHDKIMLASCNVREFYSSNIMMWVKPQKPINVKALSNYFITKHGEGKDWRDYCG